MEAVRRREGYVHKQTLCGREAAAQPPWMDSRRVCVAYSLPFIAAAGITSVSPVCKVTVLCPSKKNRQIGGFLL